MDIRWRVRYMTKLVGDCHKNRMKRPNALVMGLVMGIGAATALSVALSDIAVGLACGVGAGLAIGLSFSGPDRGKNDRAN